MAERDALTTARAMRSFARIELGDDRIPDETPTIHQFPPLLETARADRGDLLPV